MLIQIFKGATEDNQPDTSGELLATFKVNGIQAVATNHVGRKEGSTKPKVSLSFELTRSGLVNLAKAEAKLEELVEYQEKVKITKEETPEAEKEESEEGENVDEEKVEGEKVDEEKQEGEASEQTENSEESVEGETEEKEPQKPEEPEYETITKTKMQPHTFPLNKIDREFEGLPLLNSTQIKQAKKRIAAFEKKDEMKLKTDEAKNNFESIMYSFRDWLQEEDNLLYVGEERQQELLAQITEDLDWLDYGDGDKAGFEEFNSKYLGFKEEMDKYSSRQEEDKKRIESVEKARAKLEELKEKASQIRQKKEWISEEEEKDVQDKVSETQSWVEEKMNEQSQKSPSDEPAFTAKELDKKVKDVEKLYKKVFGKKKPKPSKKEKSESGPTMEEINMDDIKVENIDLGGMGGDGPKFTNFNSENIKFENVNFGDGINMEDVINTGEKATQE